MLVACVSGSPRKGENSERIVEKARGFFTENGFTCETILLSGTTITPCINCNYCKTKHRCGQDEEANRVNDILSGADGILLVSPVYFGGISGQLKCLMDKTLPLRRDGMRLKGKIGAAIAVGNSRNGGQELAVKDAHAWMLIHGMVIVGDNSHFGGTVRNPFEEDGPGGETVKGTLEAMKSLLLRVGPSGKVTRDE